MSQLCKQLQNLLPELSKQAKELKCEDAKRRWNDLRYVAKSQRSVKLSCMKVGRSQEWFRKWAHRLLKARNSEVLRGKSRRPRKSRKRLSKVWRERILMVRRSNPFEGCERIARRIYEVYGKKISPGTVHKILVRNGFVSKRKQKSLTKKHLKRYRRPWPGYLQMDFKYVPYRINGRQFYQLSCVDHHSSWRMIRIYPRKDLEAVETFLLELEVSCPFPILQIQTDNDLAFTHKFWRLTMGFDPTNAHPLEEWCKEHGIEHKLIPVGEKELNGKVENTHKQDDREFFSQINPQNLTHLQALSLVYEQRWNERRNTKALGWKTPNETLVSAYTRAVAWHQMLGLPTDIIVRKIPKGPEKAKRTKRKSIIRRYLNWIEEDAKKYGTND